MRRRAALAGLRILLCPLLLGGVGARLAGQELVVLREDTVFYRLGGVWSFAREETESAALADIRGLTFVPQAEDEPSLGFGGVPHWARFSAVAEGGEWILECAYSPMDLIELYAVRNGAVLEVQRAGDSIPARDHPIPSRTFRFQLAVDQAALTTFYVRIKTAGSAHASFRIWRADALAQRDLTNQLLLGAYFGLMAVMALFGVLFFLSARELFYLYYVGYVLFHALFQASYLGVSMRYLWPGSSWWTNTSLVVFASLAVVFSALFTREFLQRGKLVPRLKLLIDVCLWVSAVNCVAAFVVPYAVSILVTNVTLLLFSGVYVLAGIQTLRRGYTPARFYLIAWSVLLLAVFWLALANFGLVGTSGFTANPLQVGSIFEVLFLSLAIWDRIAHLRQQNVHSERELRLSRERELQAAEDQLYHDALTGLPNRTKLIADSLTFHSPTLFLINVDRFKQVNDFYGNKVGDRVLQELRRRIEACAPPRQPRLYRLHADEYALVLEGELAPEQCLVHGSSLHASCVAEPYDIAGQRVRLNVSIGVSRSGGSLLEQADMALVEARAHGSSVRIYDPSMETMKQYAENLRWVSIIRDALKADAVLPFFQPIRDNATGSISKYESLIRLRLDSGEIVSPGAFLDVAKASKLYPELSQRAIRKSFAAFDGVGTEFSVNISIEDILQEETLAVIRECLRRHDVRGRVVFEILESEGIHRYEVASSFIEAVKAEGCKIAIDDFGSGYSNFEHILRLKVDYLKLDASLVRNLDTDAHAYAIVETMQQFAARLGLQTIAEYVHSAAVQAAVERLGVHFSQGYYIGAPAPRSAAGA